MKHLRYSLLVTAVTLWSATAAFACDGAGSTKGASASNGTDACCSQGKTTATAASMKHAGCPAMGTTAAATNGASCRMGKTANASANNCPMSAAACQAMAASGACTAEMRAQCAKGAAAVSMDHCAKGASAASMAKGSCTMHGNAATAAAAGRCDMHGMASHTDCAVCADEASCDGDVRAAGARAQVVSLRNGAMIVYTVENPANVRALQTAVARHNQRVLAALAGQGSSELCSDCKQLRGAMASGKFVREVVNVERGCQVLMTSSDRAIVQQIHELTNAQMAVRTRS